MGDWLGFSLSAGGADVFWLAVPPTLAAIYWLYRQTNPKPGRWGAWGLFFLRGGAVALILFTLAELALGMRHKEVVRPSLVVLLDSSSSMAVEEDGLSRLNRVKSLFADRDFIAALSGAEVSFWSVADSAAQLDADTLGRLGPLGLATDLAVGLQRGVQQAESGGNLQGILLLSDGAHNLGEDPVALIEKLEVPVFALGVGKRQNPADIQVAALSAPETGYVDRPLVIKADVRQWGYDGHTIEVVLQDGEQELGRRRVKWGDEIASDEVVFELMPREAGPRAYRVYAEPLEGEFTRQNNEAVVAVVIRQDRRQVLLAGGGPSADLAFMRRALEADSNATVRTHVPQVSGQFYPPLTTAEIGRADVIILVDPAEELITGPNGDAMVKAVEAGAGLLFVGGPRSFGAWASRIGVSSLLPLLGRREAFVAQPTLLRLGAEGRRHPVLSAAVVGDPWTRLPPLPGYLPVDLQKGAMVLIETGEGGRHLPLVAVGSHGRGNVIAAASSGFWRLELLSHGVGKGPGGVARFWRDAVQWLGTSSPVGRVRASTERRVYRSGEDVVFTAQIFDELLRPLPGSQVEISLDGQGEGSVLALADRGNGRYRRAWKGLGAGEYRFTARALGPEGEIGLQEGSFIVERRPVEAIDMRANPALLEEIARASKGAYRPLAEWRALVEVMPLQPRLMEQKRVWTLWGSDGLLWVLIALLSLEWALRKRNGML
jgi:hypothetical protein